MSQDCDSSKAGIIHGQMRIVLRIQATARFCDVILSYCLEENYEMVSRRISDSDVCRNIGSAGQTAGSASKRSVGVRPTGTGELEFLVESASES
jgi:hypothetical protein